MESHNSKDNEHDSDFSSEDSSAVTDQLEISPENASSAGHSLRRRRIAGENPISDSSVGSVSSTIDDSVEMNSERETLEIHWKCNDDGKKLEQPGDSSSTVTTGEMNSDGVSEAESGDSSSNLISLISDLLVKAIGAQISCFIYSTCFPLWFLYHCYNFVFHPLQTIKNGRAFATGKFFGVWELVFAVVRPLISERFKERNSRSLWKIGLRCLWGLMWSAYVCVILFGLLISALLFSGVFMKLIVQEPVKMQDVLKFDYTKPSPEAFMPILPDSNDLYGRNCEGNVVSGTTSSRVIPYHHQLQAVVSLTLPESEFNKNLGVFQVRVDFLSVNGDILASSSQPCILQFKSEPIRLLLTILKLAPLVTGYISESQTLNLKLKGFTEGSIPTSCLRVTIEERAEFNPGAGIPEIYGASLVLESELPLFKRIIWYWRKTLYVWISMTSFMMQLLFTLVCCRPIFVSKRRRNGSANARSP